MSLYGQLAAGMSPGTFVAGEAASVSPLRGDYFRSMYLPPNAASNASFLETLRLMLVHETRDRAGAPRGLELAYATPRAWLEPGKRIAVRNMPTSFGPLSYEIASAARDVQASIDVPAARRPVTLRLRLRLPAGRIISTVLVSGRPASTTEQPRPSISRASRDASRSRFASRPSSAGAAFGPPRYHRRVAEADGKPLDERLEEIGAQLAWVRDYL